MFDARQIRRAIVLAGVLATCAAPAASARPADERSYAKPSATAAQSDAPKPRGAPRLGGQAARREARTAQQWQAVNRPSVAAIQDLEGDGFNWPSAAIGASVPLTFVLFGVMGHALIAHRRRVAGDAIAPTAPTSA
jgi:hypothetical protein